MRRMGLSRLPNGAGSGKLFVHPQPPCTRVQKKAKTSEKEREKTEKRGREMVSYGIGVLEGFGC